MKLIKILVLFIAITTVSFSCKKSAEDSGPACENNETTKVTFKNTSTLAARLELADRFDSNYKPVGIVFSIDLAPGATATKEFKSGRYYIQWKCSTCNTGTVSSKTYETCMEYQE